MTVSPEQVAAAKAAYDTAVTAQQAAKAIVDNLKATSADTVIAYERAKAAYEALKPNQSLAKAKLDRANADVTIARAELKAVDPKAFPSTKGTGKWGVAPATAPAPSFLAPPSDAPPAPPEAPAEVPSFLAPPTEATPAVSDALGEDFPGVEALAEAGLTTRSSLAGKTAADLVAIPGIGAKTADKILAAV